MEGVVSRIAFLQLNVALDTSMKVHLYIIFFVSFWLICETFLLGIVAFEIILGKKKARKFVFVSLFDPCRILYVFFLFFEDATMKFRERKGIFCLGRIVVNSFFKYDGYYFSRIISSISLFFVTWNRIRGWGEVW